MLKQMSRESPSTAREVVELFLREGLRLVAALRSAAAAHDPAAVRRLAHELNGAASMVGAGRVTSLVRALQRASKSDDFASMEHDLSPLEDALVETHRVLSKTLLAGN